MKDYKCRQYNAFSSVQFQGRWQQHLLDLHFYLPCVFHYQLVDRVFDESLNFKKIPPVISTNSAPEVNGKPVELRPRAPDSLEPRALRRRTWNREEVGPADLQGGNWCRCVELTGPVCVVQAVLDSLLLHSVSQLSTKIRHSVDKTAGKIRWE